LNSWSDNGSWTAFCYTADHAEAQKMWDKPAELTAYPGYGYEIAYTSSGDVDPAAALTAWQLSSGSDDVILNNNGWAGRDWNAIGIGISGKFAVVWFGEDSDPAAP
jgi:hypothetical protein